MGSINKSYDMSLLLQSPLKEKEKKTLAVQVI